MNPVILNVNIIGAIKEKLPEEVSLIHFLSDLLPLNKEAIYRRLRGEVVFSFFEIYLIAEKLEISLDQFFTSFHKENVSFELILQQFQNTKNSASNDISKFEQILGNVLKEPSSTFELSHNLFPQVPTHMFFHLSKYNSFKWVYKNRITHAIPFKKIEYPQEIYQMHRANNNETMKIKNTSYIWDYKIVEMLVEEIKYFAKINLIDKEDVAILKEELHEFLLFVEELTIKCIFPTGNKINIYISPVNSDAAYSYIETPDYKICMIGVFDFQYIFSTDKKAFDLMKRKIMSLKKGATLISGSNEIYRIRFFRTQHELIDTL